jgi:iron complex outermembrane receptor protein
MIRIFLLKHIKNLPLSILIFIVFGLITFPKTSLTQTLIDTLKLPQFEIFESKKYIPKSYKISQIDSSFLNQNLDKNIGAIIGNSQGIFIKNYGANSLSTINLRGADAKQVKTFWNGLEINGTTHGINDFVILPSFFLNDVGVHYGNSGLFDGVGGFGGNISLNNQIENSQTEITLLSGIGSFKSFYNHQKVKTNINGFQMIFKSLQNESKNDFEYQNLANFGFPIDTLQNANFKQNGLQGEISKSMKNHDFQLIYNTLKTFREIPGNMFNNKILQESQFDNNTKSLLKWSFKKRGFHISATTGYFIDKMLYINSNLDDTSKFASHSWKNKFNFHYQFNNLKISSSLSVDWLKANTSSYVKNHSQIRENLNLNLEYWATKKLTLSTLSKQLYINNKNNFINSLSLNYKPITKQLLYLYFNIGNNKNYATFNDLYWINGGNENLKTESSKSVELGAKWQTKPSQKAQFKTEINGYLSEINNKIIWLPITNSQVAEKLNLPIGIWAAQNINSIMIQGLESISKLSFKINKINWVSQVKYNYNKSISNEKLLIYSPKHILNFHQNISWKQLQISYQISNNGKYFTSVDNSEFLPTYQLHNLHLTCNFKIKIHHFLTLKVEINNLLDTEYQTVKWQPMPTRNFNLSLKYSFLK